MKAPRACLMLALIAVTFRSTLKAGQPANAHPPACASCHKDIVKNFAGDPHSKPAHLPDGEEETCASCHGPGKAHAENGAIALIFNPARASGKEIDKKCEECHGPGDSHFERSVHGKSNVSCIGCHVVHAAGSSRYLLKAAQPGLCFQCHSDVNPQFSAPYRHNVREGLINCTDCHDPHGGLGEDSLPSAAWQFMVCTKCHVSTAGPFLYEHAAVKAEGCSACHYPHGGPNPRLLIQANVNTICAQCHYPSANSRSGLTAVPAHLQSAQSQSCISCHTSIHGSNLSDIFLNSMQRGGDH